MSEIFTPHALKTIEVDTEKKIFKVNGEEFGKGCTGFRITCMRYDEFDIRVEVDTTVHYISIRGSEVEHKVRKNSDPEFGQGAT